MEVAMKEVEELLGVRAIKLTTAPRYTSFTFPVTPELKELGVEGIEGKLTDELGLLVRAWADGNFLHVEVPRQNFAPVTLLGIVQKQRVGKNTIVLGRGNGGTPLFLEITNINIFGEEGSGKTELLRTMAASLALFNDPQSLRLVLVDLVEKAFKEFVGLPHLARPPAFSLREARSCLAWACKEAGKQHPTYKVVVFIDNANEPELWPFIEVVAERGGETGVYIVVASERPFPEELFPVKIVGKGENKLLGEGDFLLVFPQNQKVIRFQAAYTSSEAILAISR
jgi:hypothetical protein